MALGYGRTGTNQFATAKFIVDTNGLSSGATHSTIASALSDAVSGETIFIKPGTYTENLTLKAGVNLAAFDCDSVPLGNQNVLIDGKLSASYSGSAAITGIALQTNADFCVEVTGANATVLLLDQCQIISDDNTAISNTGSDGTSSIVCRRCQFAINNAAIANWSISNGIFAVEHCISDNTGNSTTANTNSGEAVYLRWSYISQPLTTSGTTAYGEVKGCWFQIDGLNQTCITHNSTDAANLQVSGSVLKSGTASPISIGAGATIELSDTILDHSNATAIAGAGTVTFSDFGQVAGTGTVAATIGGGRHNLANLVLNSATAYAVLCGGTTTGTPLQSIAGLGSSGDVLTSNGAGALPTFQAAAGGGALVFLAQSTASASATIEFDNTVITSTYDHYVILVENFAPASDGVYLTIELSNDNTATWEVTNYSSTGYNIQANATVAVQAETTAFALSDNALGSAAAEVTSMEIHLVGAASATLETTLFSNGFGVDNAGNPELVFGAGTYTVQETINAIRLLYDTGNIASGTVKVYGVADS